MKVLDNAAVMHDLELPKLDYRSSISTDGILIKKDLPLGKRGPFRGQC